MNSQLVTSISKEPKEQYWYIRCSGLMYCNPQKIIVKSYSELRDYIHNQLDWMRSDCINEMDDNSNIKHIYKRVTRSRMYVDVGKSISNVAGSKAIGYCFEVNASMKNGEIEPLATFWCERVPKREVGNIEYSGFKELEY